MIRVKRYDVPFIGTSVPSQVTPRVVNEAFTMALVGSHLHAASKGVNLEPKAGHIWAKKYGTRKVKSLRTHRVGRPTKEGRVVAYESLASMLQVDYDPWD